MKKKALVLSCVFGGITLLILLGIFVLPDMFSYIESDSDTSSYESYSMVYNNGTLVVKDGADLKCDIITSSSKKSVEYTSEEYIDLLKYKYSLEFKNNTVYVIDENGKRTSSFPLEDIVVNTDLTDENDVSLLSSNSVGMFRYKLYVNKKDVYYLGVDEDGKYLYVEYLVHEDITTAYYYRYDLATSKLADIHTVEFCDNVTQGVSVIRDIFHCERIAVGDYVFYEFSYRNYLRSKLYRHNVKSRETVVVGEFENCSFTGNDSSLYYTRVVTDEWVDKAESGIWKMDADTLETTQITSKYAGCEFLCTENYIYVYINHDIVIPPLPSYEPIIIERGYDVKQIPIKSK